MVCPYCGHDSEVYNSRPRKKGLAVWRRRRCPACKAVWTTHEEIAEDSYRVRKNGALQAFRRPVLYLSLYECLKHRHNAPTEAELIAQTVVLKLQQENKPLIDVNDLKKIAAETLNHFDTLAGQLYGLAHPISKK